MQIKAIFLALPLIGTLLGGCAGLTPAAYDFDPDARQEGPGLFSGEQGEFVIFGN